MTQRLKKLVVVFHEKAAAFSADLEAEKYDTAHVAIGVISIQSNNLNSKHYGK